MTAFSPHFNVNAKGCGPDVTDPATLSSGLAAVQKFPFEPSLKTDMLGKVCDFTFATYQRNLRESVKWGGVPPSQAFAEELRFYTVDNRPISKSRTFWNRRKVLKESTEAFNQKQQQELAMQLGRKTRSEQKKQQAAQKARQQRITARHKTFSEWSIEPTSDWKLVHEIPLNQLYSQKIETSETMCGFVTTVDNFLLSEEEIAMNVEDICWRGRLLYYNKQVDRISPKAPVPLTQFNQDLDFYWVSTKDDDIIKEVLLDENSTVQVAATAQVLSCLMSAPQSRYSWHLNITKMEGKIIIDKTDGSIVDLLTVNETAQEPPTQDAENRLNRPHILGVEAVKINQNFSQQVLERDEKPAETFPSPPFIEMDDVPANVAYRYRIFTLPGRASHPTEFGKSSIKIITRAEVNAKLRNVNEGSYTALCSVNEYDLRSQKNWHTQIENQQGALLATEIRNNANRLQKCVASALIAGCDTLKMGFVSRRSPKDADNHILLVVQSHKTMELGLQIGLRMSNAWGIVRAIVDMIMEQPDGVYTLLKDPTKAILRLYIQPDEDEEETNVQPIH
ncbi:putative eukaryotic translation initiation factor 3 subunit 7 [Cardiosporidium cionae]|uniref:Eukaryotic translation initiation factor 3 subunit 7 n=1 Tax=Cardiosporidium cionae TaxID=476202 RepID=A0ABQ7JCU1_9APIC|nr:putative eukaryotic translation initiation factor 3 subunit 7 [Cardiosporidium cionae]|eukprot:KAF8821779.1 putative eukaryotic translation initiation factor 3 subunit 7 [Cardiosporidium cionae]